MKVLVVGTGGTQGSGISTAADQTARLLKDRGHQVARFTAGDRPRRRPSRLNVENLSAAAGDAWGVARAARRFDADVVMYHTFGVPTLPGLRALAVVLASRLTGRRAVVWFHAYGLEEFVASGGLALRLVVSSLGRAASLLIAVHEPAANALRRFVPAARVVAIGNWVDVPPAPGSLPRSPPFVLVFVGGLVTRKGAPELLDAMRLVADVPVVLRLVGGAGEDGVESHAALRASAADLVAAGTVTFVGEVGPDAVREELRRGHAFVLPSRAEGSPLAMLEAMAEGRPVVVTDAGNMRDIVQAAACGIVLTSREPQAIAQAIRQVVERSDELAAMGQRAHAAAQELFSPSATATAIEQLLVRVADG